MGLKMPYNGAFEHRGFGLGSAPMFTDTPLLANPWTWFAVGYLLGAIPFGLIVTRLAGMGDIRRLGSGNIGTTNVLRTGGKSLAALTLLLDAGKGALAVWLGQTFAYGGDILGGMGAFIGHLFPAWLLFRGGKGVATMLGIALAIYPPAGLVFAAVWLLVAAVTRYSSLAGLMAVTLTPLAPALTGRWDATLLFAGMAVLVIAKHDENIARLRAGTEGKIGGRNGASDPHG
jgi:acyl phosphate:glycerol-3-phosphate acyltransferase